MRVLLACLLILSALSAHAQDLNIGGPQFKVLPAPDSAFSDVCDKCKCCAKWTDVVPKVFPSVPAGVIIFKSQSYNALRDLHQHSVPKSTISILVEASRRIGTLEFCEDCGCCTKEGSTIYIDPNIMDINQFTDHYYILGE